MTGPLTFAYPVFGERTPLWVLALLFAGGLAAASGATYVALRMQASYSDRNATVPRDRTVLPGSAPSTSTIESSNADAPSIATNRPVTELSTLLPTDCAPLFRVLFPKGSYVVSSDEDIRQRGAILSGWMKRNLQANLIVEGHASAVGAEQKNLILGNKRAQYIVDLLVGEGIPGSRITPRSYGHYQPQTGIQADAPDNQRVVLRVNPSDSRCPAVGKDVFPL